MARIMGSIGMAVLNIFTLISCRCNRLSGDKKIVRLPTKRHNKYTVGHSAKHSCKA
jgi:hypothetical protein